MKPVRCLVVDDERLARRHVLRLLAGRMDVEVVGEAATRAEALRAVEASRPNLLILDVMMPGGGGFEILDALPEPPQVVFVTAHDRYAVRAFDVRALDYLLKPISADRFGAAMDRAIAAIAAKGDDHLGRPRPSRPDDTTLVEVGRSGDFVAVEDILAIEAEGNYTRLATEEGRPILVRQAMRHWLECLPREGFVQLDRSIVVNVRRIRSMEAAVRASVIVLGDRAYRIRLGAAATARLREVLGR